MTKPFSQADEPTLFPREWVIGRAAADLVRDDEGVLLDQPWLDPQAGAPGPAGPDRPASPFPAPQGGVEESIGAVSAGSPALVTAQPLPGADTAFASPATAGESRRRRSPRPTAAEIDELKAGQARLQRRFEAARMRPRPRYVGVSADRAPAMIAAPSTGPVRRRPFPWRRLAIVLLLALLASSLYQYRAVLLQI